MGAVGGTEWIIIIIAILILFFGAKKIPELARGIGEGINEFKDATNKEELDDNKKNENTTQSDSAEKQKKKAES